MLDDLNEFSSTGKRVPGGLVRRIELANLYRMALEDELKVFARSNPERYAAIWEWLQFAQNQAVRQSAERMEALSSEAA